jgi:putative SOS response-associated peptidase YedK
MCGRFAFWETESFKERFKTVNSLVFAPSYNITPGFSVPVITRHSPNQGELMKWGLIPFWAKDPRIGFKMINARSEEIEVKPSFRKPIRSQRCIIPANGFYEWKKLSLEKKPEKIPFFIKLKNERVIGLAGIYDIWKDVTGRETKSFAIITTAANKIMSDIHDRMPVILKEKDEELWLESSTAFNTILGLLKPYPSEEMITYPVSRLVNDPDSNNKEIVEPLLN